MEKISGILPSNPRIKSVDMKNAHPQRPGTPDVGQKMGRSSVQDRMRMSEEANDRALQDTLAVYNPREARHAKIAEDVTRGFFDNRLKPDLRESKTADLNEVPTKASVQPVSVSSATRAARAAAAAEPPTAIDDGDQPVSSLDLYA